MDWSNAWSPLSAEDVHSIADALGVDLRGEWKLDRDYLELHTKDQLAELAAEWKLKLEPGKRGEQVDALLELGRSMSAPKLLVKASA